MKLVRLSPLVLVALAITLSLAVRARAQTVTYLAELSASYARSVIQATDGNFYGTTFAGGAHDKGQVFRMTPGGELSTIYSFCSQSECADGATPLSVVLGSDGSLYGVTDAGGSAAYPNGSGTVFKLTLGGEFTNLHTFCPSVGCADGENPNGIIQASDGNFYGTTVGGGKFEGGTIFQISPAGQFNSLHSFCAFASCLDGETPQFPPIQANDGNFYGSAYGGGTLAGGVFYELTSAGAYKVLYNFCVYDDETCNVSPDTGSGPTAIVEAPDGNFYGTTVFGGIHNDGTLFEITSTNHYGVLHRFNNRYAEGESPLFGLTLASDGNFYGVLLEGGSAGEGTAFEVTPQGAFTVLHNFSDNEGATPVGPLFQGTDGSLYGTTEFGFGSLNGTIYSLSNGLSPLVETVPVAGPVGKSVLILGNNLTGSTSVTFNGVEAAFTVESDSYVKATVPKGATTGTVSVVTSSGTLNSNPQFVVTK